MPQSVITNGSAFQFKDFVLQGVLTRWNHRIGIRLASHEYLKRDGGEQEPMGAAVGRFSYSCVLIGPDVTARYNNLVLSVRRDPRGILVDPRLGRIQAACEGIDAAEVAEDAVDSIEFEIRFAEDQVDSALASEQPVSPNAYSANVLNSVTTLTDLVDARFLGNFATHHPQAATLEVLAQRIAAELAYAAAYSAAWRRLYPDERFGADPLPAPVVRQEPPQADRPLSARLMLFVDAAAPVKSNFLTDPLTRTQALAGTAPSIGLDVYVVGAKDEARVERGRGGTYGVGALGHDRVAVALDALHVEWHLGARANLPRLP